MLEMHEIAPDIYRLQVPVPVSVENVNLYLFTGGVPTLLDAGTNSPEALAAVHEGLQAAGVERLEQIVITHWHVDHAGAAAKLAETGARVVVSEADFQEWAGFTLMPEFEQLHRRAYREWEVPDAEIPGMLAIYDFLRKITSPPPDVDLIHPREEIQMGNYFLQAIGTPGHSVGHLSFYAAKERLLFTGDQLLPDQIPYPGIWEEEGKIVSGLPSYLSSLERIEALQAKLYLPAHGLPQEDLRQRCQNVREQIFKQVELYQPLGSIYEAALSLSKGRSNPGVLFMHLHYVFGWDRLKRSF